MVVISMDSAPESLRGELSRWFLEIKPGVFVGNVNARIRDLLWERLCLTNKTSGAIMVYSKNNEQGYEFKLCGCPKRSIIDLDDIQLVKIEAF